MELCDRCAHPLVDGDGTECESCLLVLCSRCFGRHRAEACECCVSCVAQEGLAEYHAAMTDLGNGEGG